MGDSRPEYARIGSDSKGEARDPATLRNRGECVRGNQYGRTERDSFSLRSCLLKVDCASKSWNDIQVRYFEKYPGPGKAYADMSSERSTLVVCLEQRGGHC